MSAVNLQALQEYSERFSREVCNRFFTEHEKVEGQQLSRFSSVKQVNLFMVRILFEKWQEEAARLQSPYFNYAATEVKKSFNQLMKALSTNIRMDKATALALTEQATYETLLLQLDPIAGLAKMLDGYPDKLSEKLQLRPLLKYVRIHPKLVEQMGIKVLGEATDYQKKDFIGRVKLLLQKHPDLIQQPHTLIDNFSRTLPVGLYQLAPDFDESYEDLLNFDDDLPLVQVNSFEPTDRAAPKAAAERQARPHAAVSKPAATKQEPTPAPRQAPAAAQQAAKSAAVPAPERVLAPAPKKQTTALPAEDIVSKPAAFFKPEADADDERTAQPGSLLHKLNNQQQEKKEPEEVEQIKLNVPLNMRLRFQQELFNNSKQEYEEAIALLDSTPDYHTAIMKLKRNYMYKYDWDLSNDTTVEFLSMLDNQRNT